MSYSPWLFQMLLPSVFPTNIRVLTPLWLPQTRDVAKQQANIPADGSVPVRGKGTCAAKVRSQHCSEPQLQCMLKDQFQFYQFVNFVPYAPMQISFFL
jgi:hypothetical protein